MNREALAWAGGFFSGEGSTVFSRPIPSRASKQICFVAGQSGRRLPEVLIRMRDAIGFGRFNGPYKHKGRKNPTWFYRAYGFEKVQAAVAMLWPWLSREKKDQAIKAMQNFLGMAR